jgi:thiosulfate dehydrogenase
LELLSHTRLRLPAYDGARLNCTSCHLDGGRRTSALPWYGAVSHYPRVSARAGGVVTLSERIDECFERSLNGRRLPAASPERSDILAYFAALSREAPASARAPAAEEALKAGPPDERAGAEIYARRCAVCHGRDGSGRETHGADNPPLWGDASFNLGAGMARLRTAERFIRRNMPVGAEGSLSDQEARDAAAFVTRRPRPDFAAKTRDWPKGGKPDDARY